jgi:hypothetical protein
MAVINAVTYYRLGPAGNPGTGNAPSIRPRIGR